MSEFLSIFSGLDSLSGALTATLGQYGIIAIFVSVLFLGETAIFIAILLTQQGVLNLDEVFVFALLATLCADVFWFIFSRYFPQRIIPAFLKKFLISPVNSFFGLITKDRIFLSIFFLKFFIGARLIIILYLAHRPITFMRFLLYDALGSLMYMVLITGVGVVFGNLISKSLSSHHVIVSIASGLFLVLLI